MHKIKPGFITSNLKLGEERPGLHCKYSTTCSNMDGLGTVYLERICIAEQILNRLLCYAITKLYSEH